ncbi:MAG: hypothetical protein IJ830_06560 [Alphaproteobacteria bacterium]|nr:hypothetical protein [Alphaproteobacteria bacterium]
MKMNENGRSMVEMLGVLAIIGVLSAGGLAGYSKAMFKHKLNSTMDQITMLVTNIRTMYGTQGNYSGLNNGSAVNLGIVPAVMDGGSGSGSARGLTNPFKGGVTITTTDATTGSAASGTSATGFKLTYDGLPTEACIALATADFGSGAGSGFIGVEAENSKITTKAIGANEGTALSMDNAIAGCNKSTNTVSWYFY